MDFASDNWAGASPRVRDALAAACNGVRPAYGNDDATKALQARFAEIFEHEVAMFLVPTGTAANSLALAALCPPYGAVLAHRHAHVVEDECGAPEFFTAGAKLVGVAGPLGKLTPESVAAAAEPFAASNGRAPLGSALSITQATEFGTVYTPSEIAAVCDAARHAGLPVHMDGARFTNALVHLNASPAEVTWRSGVDVLSFGGTKNGALMAEAVLFFNVERAGHFARRRQRGGHTVSKARLIADQFLALLADGHWLDLARHANAMAARLAEGLAALGHRVPWPVEANEVFPVLPADTIARLREAGARFYEWPALEMPADAMPREGEAMVRLVASFATSEGEVERLIALAA